MLEWTGERFLPDVGVSIAYEHYSRYFYATEFVKGKAVLDCPCGEGYGSHILSQYAANVVGVDISEDAVKHCQERYKSSNLQYRQGSMADLNWIADGTMDVVVCFEGIEHVDQKTQALALKEFRRVLKPDGLVLISTPNKKVYSDQVNHHNEYHIHEFYIQEFAEFLKSEFQYVTMLGQTIAESCFISDINNRKNQSTRYSVLDPDTHGFELSNFEPDENWIYCLGVCRNTEGGFGQIPSAVFIDFKEKIYGEKRFGVVNPLNELIQSMNVEIQFLKDENLKLNSEQERLTKILRKTVEGRLYFWIKKVMGKV